MMRKARSNSTARTTTPSVPASASFSELAEPSRESPSKIWSPRPGPATYEAMAAIPMIIWVDTRSPVRISGQASGIWIRQSTWNALIPMPRAGETRDTERMRIALRGYGSLLDRVLALTR